MPAPDALLRQIGYAEDWLRRARRDWQNGDTRGALRRLMLAEAEIRHARETGAVLQRPAADRAGAAPGRRLVAGLVAALLLAAGIGYASKWTGTPQPRAVAVRRAGDRLSRGVGRTIVQLDSGRFLMPDPGQESVGTPAGPGFTVPGARVDRAPADRWPHLVVPVDLRTSSPTF
jgi:hypothetical protein